MDQFQYQKPPVNERRNYTGKLELRKLWAIPDAKYIWALYEEISIEKCALVDEEPNWDDITETTYDWGTRQGFLGDEEWAKTTAEHFGIEFPEEEYKVSE